MLALTSDQIATIAISVLGSALASGLSVWAMLYLHKKADKALEKDEVRKRKVEILHEVIGSRYVLSDNYAAMPEETRHFNRAMAHFSVYFADDAAISDAYDRFIEFKTDENLVALLRSAAKSLDVDVLDSSIRNVVTVRPRTLPVQLVAEVLDRASKKE